MVGKGTQTRKMCRFFMLKSKSAFMGTLVFLSLCSCPVTAPHWLVDVTSDGSLI